MTFYPRAVILFIEKVLPVDGQPLGITDVTALLAGGRSLLFFGQTQANNTNDQNAKLKQIGICNH